MRKAPAFRAPRPPNPTVKRECRLQRPVVPPPHEPTTGPGTTQDAASATSRPSADEQDLAPRPRRTELTAFEVTLLVDELQSLVGGHLDKAYQPTREEVLLRFRAPEVGRRDLFVRRGSFACLTEHPPENPTHPPGFAMALRKHVCGGKVTAVEQHGFDRVLTVSVQKHEGIWRIVIELFGDGNVVAVRPDGRIFMPLVTEHWGHRTIRAGTPYETPPARADPLTFDRDAFIAHAKKGNRDLVRALAIECNLGGPTAEEVLLRAGLDKAAPIETVDEDALGAAFDEWDALRTEATEGSATAHLLYEEDRAVDFSGFASTRLAREAGSDGTKRLEAVPSLSLALDRLFLAGRRAAERVEAVEEVDERRTKLERQRAAQEAAITKFDEEAAEKVREGETIFAHYAIVERILETIRAARREHDWKEIEARLEAGAKAGNEDADRVVALRPKEGRVVLRLEDMEGVARKVPVDIRLSVGENAEAAYDRAKKAREKLAGAKEALASTLERMAAAESDLEEAHAAVDEAMERTRVVVTPNRHFWFESFRWFFASTGHLVVAGRDAATNDRVVKKHLEEGDRYVHADLHGAPSTVVKADGESAPEPALEEAAQAAVTWSRAFGRFGGGDAYWVRPQQVSKTPQAGEFLARGAFIVRGERDWFRKLPLEASIGLVWLDASGRPTDPPEDAENPGTKRAKIMAGAPRAVHAWTDTWVDLVAGETKRKDMVQRLARILRAHPDTLDRALPVGDLMVKASKGVPEHAVHGRPEPDEEEPGEGEAA